MQGKIHFIFTGGTIDGVFNTSQYKPVPSSSSLIPNYLKNYVNLDCFSHCQVSSVDGLDMNDDIRSKIVDEIRTSQCDKIIITHGTDNLTITAETVAQNDLDKTIVFVGAMHPLSFIPSDAGFNLGFAVAQVEHLKKGVYVCMNGKVFLPNEVSKNKKLSIFEEK